MCKCPIYIEYLRALKGSPEVLTLSGQSRPMKRWKTTEPTNCPKLNDDDWRILAVNVNNFPTEADGANKAKLDMLRKLVGASDSDIVGMSEIGRNEKKMKHKNKPSEIVKKWVPNGVTISDYNVRTTDSTFEPGGVMMLTRDKSTTHTIQKGVDKRRLGRWT